MPSLKVRRATTADIGLLVKQRHNMFEDMKHRSSRDHKIADSSYKNWAILMMKRKLLICFLVTDSSRDVVGGGCIWLREEQPRPGHPARRIPYLMSMYTDPEHRGKGVASLVLQTATSWSKESGYPEMTLHASRQGRPLYLKMGWEEGNEMTFDLEGSKRRKTKSSSGRFSLNWSGTQQEFVS
jgi:GNAT superfamily N-acetyltransferase